MAITGFLELLDYGYAAKFDPSLSLDCAPMPSTLAQSKERKGSNFAIWQPWSQEATCISEFESQFVKVK